MERMGETQRAYLWLMKLDAIEKNISELGCWGQVHDCRWLWHRPADGQLSRTAQMHLSKQKATAPNQKTPANSEDLLPELRLCPFLEQLQLIVQAVL